MTKAAKRTFGRGAGRAMRGAAALLALIAALAACALGARAQGSRKDGIVLGPTGHPVAGPTITVCVATATGTPCAPLATLYTDATLTTTAPNPFQGDGIGNYHFYAPAGRYLVQITGPGISGTQSYPDVILPPDVSSTGTGNNISAFGLTLGGNLNVGGNATVSGNAAVSGTLTAGTFSPSAVSTPGNLSVGGNATITGNTTVNGTFTAANFNPGNITPSSLAVLGNTQFKGPAPWIDVRQYGARTFTYPVQTTTATTSAGSASVSVASAIDFIAGDGIVISKAGAATTQTTPAAPTATVIGATGTSTISYEVVGEDAMEGLTAASPALSVTTAPTVFGAKPVLVSTYSISGGVATINFSTAINAAADEHAICSGPTLNTAGIAGIYLIASAPSGTSITYSTTAANGSGSGTSTDTCRLVNGFVLTSLTRTGTTLTATTDEAHNFNAGTPGTPTVVQIWGAYPPDCDGWYTIASSTSTTFTMNTGYTVPGGGTETCTIATSTPFEDYAWNAMGAIVWESVLVSGPALAGTTQKYYVYANYGSGYSLVGSTLPGEVTFRDWGPYVENGYVAPPAAAIPSTPPAAAQNQEFVGTIASISGTTLALNQTVPTAVTSQNAYHDDSLAIQAADNASCTSGWGTVYLSPNGNLGSYIWNAPWTVTSSGPCPYPYGELPWAVGAPITANDTLTVSGPVFHPYAEVLTGSGGTPQFGMRAYQGVGGYGNPMMMGPPTLGITPMIVSGLIFNGSSNGQTGLFITEGYSQLSDDAFYAGTFDASTPLVIGPTGFWDHLHNIYFGGYPQLVNYGSGGASAAGQPNFMAPIGVIEAQTNQHGGENITLDGDNNCFGRGILLDSTGGQSGGITYDEFDNFETFQAPWTPLLMISGNQQFFKFKVANATMDSHWMPVVANLSGTDWTLHSLAAEGLVTTGGVPILTGNQFPSVVGSNLPSPVGQNTNFASTDEFNLFANDAYDSSNCCGNVRQATQTNGPVSGTEFISPLPAPIVSSVTVTSGGSYPVQSSEICVVNVGWNNGWSLPACQDYTTTSGNQTLNITMGAAPPAGSQGYLIFDPPYKCFGNNCAVGSVTTTGTTWTQSAPAVNSLYEFVLPPTAPGDGLSWVSANGVGGAKLTLYNGYFKEDIASGTLAANESTSLNLTGTPNSLLYASGTNTWSALAPGGAGTLCLTESSGGAPGWGSCAGSAGSSWSALTAPTGNLAMSMGAYTSTWTFDAATGATDLFGLTDTANDTGIGILLHPHTQSGSTEVPFRADVNGVGVQVNANGVLQAIGGGQINATECGGVPCLGNSAAAVHSVAVNEGGVTPLAGAGPGTAGQILRSGGSAADPAYSDFPDMKVIPAANCNNATAGTGWSLPASGAPAAACRTGTNVQAGVLQFADGNSAQFQVDIPGDWDSSGTVYAKIYFTQGANTTSGQTIIMSIATACSSATDDPAFNAAQNFATATSSATANTPFTEALTGLTMTGCAAGGNMNVKILRGTDTATAAPNVFWVTLTFPRLLTLQAN